MLDISPFSDMCIANVFSLCELSFTILMMSFDELKFKISTYYNLFFPLDTCFLSPLKEILPLDDFHVSAILLELVL